MTRAPPMVIRRASPGTLDDLVVLDARVYRTAFLPALVALFVAAFALAGPSRSPGARACAPDVFNGERAFDDARGD